MLVVTKRFLAGLATTAQGATHGDTFLTLFVENPQVAAELKRAIFYTCNRDSLGSVNRHPIGQLAYSAVIKKLHLQMLVIASGFGF